MGASIPTLADLKKCAERECKMRARVYPRWVASGKMSQSGADGELYKMICIAELINTIESFDGDAEGALMLITSMQYTGRDLAQPTLGGMDNLPNKDGDDAN